MFLVFGIIRDKESKGFIDTTLIKILLEFILNGRVKVLELFSR